jgi:hypothetical protein
VPGDTHGVGILPLSQGTVTADLGESTGAGLVVEVDEWDRLAASSERGALLRREGLYHSHIQKWREARDEGASAGLTDKPSTRARSPT